MGVSANKLIYDFERKFNSVNSGKKKKFRVVDIVSFINDAYETVISYIISNKDKNERIRNHLRPLLVADAELFCKSTKDQGVCLVEYPDNFFEIVNFAAYIKNDCCDQIKRIDNFKPQGDDLNNARRDTYRKTNYYFEQLLVYEAPEGIRIYHDGNAIVDKVVIDYYKKITPIEAAELVGCEENTYKDWDDKLIVNNVDFEIDTTYLNVPITNIAVLFASGATGDSEKVQFELTNILQINSLFK